MYETDETLIASYDDGDAHALETLISKYFAHVYSFVYSLAKSQSDASDITQDIFLKVWQKFSRFDRSKSFKPWLFTIAHNTFIDWTRKKKSILFSNIETGDAIPFEDTIADDAPLPDAVFENTEWKKILEDALVNLPIEQKEVILLHHIEDMTFESIGTMLNKPANTVKSSYRRGIQKLRRQLEAHAPK